MAKDWLNSWNRRDLDRIMMHYTEAIESISPFAVRLINLPAGKIHGKTALQEYFGKGLEKYPNLEFKLIRVFPDIRNYTILYHSF